MKHRIRWGLGSAPGGAVGAFQQVGDLGGLAASCLYGCFSKPQYIAVRHGGRVPTLRRAREPVALRLSGGPGPGRFRAWRGRTSPAIGLLSPPFVDLALAGLAANTTGWGLLKQPDKQVLPWWAPVAFRGDWADLAPLSAFFAGVALWPDLAWDGATWALCVATRGFWAGVGCSVGAPASVWAVSAAMPIRIGIHIGEGSAMEANSASRWGQMGADRGKW